MALNKYKLGELIEIVDERNSFGILDFKGLNINKEFMPTAADTNGLDESKYKVVRKERFVFSGMQTGRDQCIRVSMYTNDNPIIVSPAYTTFEIKRKDLVIPMYFFMIFLSKEKDRLGAFYSDGSIRTNLDWERFCDIELHLPDLPTQQKYVNIYLSMLENQKYYEQGLEDLKIVCDGYIEDLRRTITCEKIGYFIRKCDEKNNEGKVTLEQGINVDKQFITPHRPNENFYGRNIVRAGQIAYCTQLNNENVAIAIRKGPDCIVSGVYDVIEVISKDRLNPDYLMLWFVRKEFGRFVYWASQGTSYEFLSYENLANYKIPIPDIKIQQAIVDIYNCYIKRKEINEKLKQQIKDMCPILIKGAIEEAKEA